MEPKKKLPLSLVIFLDFLLFASLLLVFVYFHHVRMLWVGAGEEESVMVFTKKASDTTGYEGSVYDPGSDKPVVDEGQFGASFPGVFANDGSVTVLDTDEEIVSYAAKNLLPVVQISDMEYRYLYRSHDLYLTLYEVNTDLYYSGTKRYYETQYYVYDVYIRNIENLYTSYDDPRTDMSVLISYAEESTGKEVVAAVNGDYMGNRNHCLVCERNGELFRDSYYVQSDVCVLYFDGTVETFVPADYDFDAIAAKQPYQIWNFGPALLDDNGNVKNRYDPSSYDNNIIDSRHPRTAIGYYEPGHYCFVVVDGRSDDSEGVRIVQLAELMRDMGCVRAYNLDGGDSSQAYFYGDYIRVDEERREQRKLFDIICVGEAAKKQ